MNIIDKIIILTLGHPQNGWIDLKSNYMTKADFLHKLTTSKAALKTVTLIPGETSYVFLRLLAKKMNVSIKELEKVYKKVAFKNDGNILADTYKLPLGMNEEALIYYLFSQTNKKYKSFSNKIFGTWNQKKWYKYLTIASIVQKESANIKEMPIVSSVIYNRLKRSMALQMDGTLNYGKYSHVKITAKRIREDKSLYNTYKNKGIPAHPIAAVSLDAIKAAIFPSKTSYLYFVKNEKTGLHRFASTYSKHIKNINIYRYEKNLKKLQNKKKKLIIKKKEIQRIQRKDFQVFPKKSEEKTKKSVKNLWNNVK